MIRLAAVGTSSTGKSALLNALFGTAFLVDPRAGSTRSERHASINFEGTDLEVIDTPPLETHNLPLYADAFLLVCDKDLIEIEYDAACRVSRAGRPLLVALNKSDTYGQRELSLLVGQIRERLEEVVPARRVVTCSADPVRVVHQLQPGGAVIERIEEAEPQVQEVIRALREVIAEAKASLRVQAREYTREAVHRARSAVSAGWKMLRDR